MNEVYNWKDFFNLAKKMREAQKNYFKTRSGLETSKKLERDFDNAINKIEVERAVKLQRNLF